MVKVICIRVDEKNARVNHFRSLVVKELTREWEHTE